MSPHQHLDASDLCVEYLLCGSQASLQGVALLSVLPDRERNQDDIAILAR
jgi:hypothetical protein